MPSVKTSKLEILDEVQDFMSQLKDVNIDHLLEPFPVPDFIKQQEYVPGFRGLLDNVLCKCCTVVFKLALIYQTAKIFMSPILD